MAVHLLVIVLYTNTDQLFGFAASMSEIDATVVACPDGPCIPTTEAAILLLPLSTVANMSLIVIPL